MKLPETLLFATVAVVLADASSVAEDQSKAIQRNGQAMAMNNGGDTVDLLDPSGAVVQTVPYLDAEEGDLVFPAN